MKNQNINGVFSFHQPFDSNDMDIVMDMHGYLSIVVIWILVLSMVFLDKSSTFATLSQWILQ